MFANHTDLARGGESFLDVLSLALLVMSHRETEGLACLDAESSCVAFPGHRTRRDAVLNAAGQRSMELRDVRIDGPGSWAGTCLRRTAGCADGRHAGWNVETRANSLCSVVAQATGRDVRIVEMPVRGGCSEWRVTA